MRQTAALVAVLCAFGVAGGAGQEITGASTGGAAALARAERMLGHTKRVLMIAAHPDDEDTELLTYLVRREGAVTAYLSLTRGRGPEPDWPGTGRGARADPDRGAAGGAPTRWRTAVLYPRIRLRIFEID